MENLLNILLVEDEETDADLLIRFLKKEINLSYLRVWDRDIFIKALEENEYDLIIADQVLPQFSGIEAFRISKTKNIPFILITGSVSEALLTEYAKEGIDDYLLKNNLLRLPSAIKNVISKKKIERLHQELKITHENIKNSISYAKIIQEAMLPEELVLRNNFPGSFIFYKPKDILSGDFYWFKKGEDVFSVAVADCTGHGIPGALLSMMGFNILYEAVSTKKISQPSDVLDRLNKQVRRILKHGATTLNDGMDIALCTIDLKNKNMMYAGANRPLFIEREKELIEFKPDKISIGGIDNNEIQFTNHSISLRAGDRIFLFTDGYTDQFSGKTNKKITVKRLREVLVQSADLSVEEQRDFIIKFFENWKDKEEQTDDVLVMCIQIP
ncbi:MAG: SpoIIE family protein phosphatase [Bacteroidetes bacterium]|nr:SpoIIE family protein phosphatase [Bacteroidota bacterium]